MSIDLGAGLPAGTRTKVIYTINDNRIYIKTFSAHFHRLVAIFVSNQTENDFRRLQGRLEEET